MATAHPLKLRFARPTNALSRISAMYCSGLRLTVLSRFDHDGFAGVILGAVGSLYHFEFTQESGREAPRCPSPDLLLVLYVPEAAVWSEAVARMSEAGFSTVRSHNPYWDRNGQTFEDVEGYRVVLAKQEWTL